MPLLDSIHIDFAKTSLDLNTINPAATCSLEVELTPVQSASMPEMALSLEGEFGCELYETWWRRVFDFAECGIVSLAVNGRGTVELGMIESIECLEAQLK